MNNAAKEIEVLQFGSLVSYWKLPVGTIR